MSNGACKFSPFLKMSSTAGNEWSNCQHCVKPVQTIETQFRQYHVTKVGGSIVIYASPMIIKVWGVEPLGPIGVYAYALVVVRGCWLHGQHACDAGVQTLPCVIARRPTVGLVRDTGVSESSSSCLKRFVFFARRSYTAIT